MELPRHLTDKEILELAEKVKSDFGDFTEHDQYNNPTDNKDAILELAREIEHAKDMQILGAWN